jgi:transposase
MIALSCASCQESLSVQDELAGTNVPCPGCGNPLVVPQPATLVPDHGSRVARKLEMAYLAWSLDCEAGDRPMAGKAAKIIISERQQVVLNEFSKSRTVAKGIVQRATIILLGFQGLFNEEIALQVGLNRLQVGIWRQRWRDAWGSLCVWECREPHRLREAIIDILSDAPRPGAPPTFTAEQVSQIVALACEPPKLSGRPIDHWTLRELRDEAIARKIVADISVAQVCRYLQQAAVQPHRKKMWLNTTEKDPQKFQAEVENVCRTYLEAPAKSAVDGTHTVSVDEATSLQAIERNAPDKPAQPDSVPKQEFEYTRHGTTTLTAGVDVVTGLIVCPTLEATRTEPEFVAHLARTVDTDPAAEWIFVVDCLNTHMSESLVKFVAERCGLPDALGKKTTAASSNRCRHARSSCRTPTTESASSTSRSTVRGSTRSRSFSGSSTASCCVAETSHR